MHTVVPSKNIMESEDQFSNYSSLSGDHIHQFRLNQMNGSSRQELRMPSRNDVLHRTTPDNTSTDMSRVTYDQTNDLNSHEPRFFKSRAPLELYSRHMVVISAVEEGPLIFSVQLVSLQNNLELLMTHINNTKPFPFKATPNNGSICLARRVHDGLLYRSVVMGIENVNCLKLFCVDYGTTELVPFSNIFQISKEFLTEKIFTYRFALQGLSSNCIGEIKEIFSKIVTGTMLELEVVDPEGPPIVQYCNLYLDGKNVKDIINGCLKTSRAVIEPNISYTYAKVQKGTKHNIMVSYIDTVEKFFIHLYENKNLLDTLMNRLFLYCQSAPTLSLHDIKINLPCAALYTEDQIWYRAVVQTCDDEFITVQYVDYGNCEKVKIDSLKFLTPELVMSLEAQAILCSLAGLDCITLNENTTTQLEMLCLEKTITMTVIDFEHSKHCAIVDLTDKGINPPLNISKRIIELSTPRQALHAICNNAKSANIRQNYGSEVVQNPVIHTGNEEIHVCTDSNYAAPAQSSGYQRPDISTFRNRIASHINSNASLENSHYSNKQNSRKQQDYAGNQTDRKTNTNNYEDCQKPATNEFLTYTDLTIPEQGKVVVSWFINPHHFYCQLKSNVADLNRMMKSIQSEYAKEKPSDCDFNVDSAVIVKYKQDSIFYRGKVVDKKQNKYIVDFIDYGFKNVVQPEDLYVIKQNIVGFHKMAIRCKIEGVLPNKTNPSNISQAWDLFKNDEYECIFHEKDEKGYVSVDLKYNAESVSTLLIEQGFAIKACEEINDTIDFSLLCGQTVRGRILGIIDFHNFFVKLTGTNSQLHCGVYNWTCDEKTENQSKLKKSFSELVQETNSSIIYINDVKNSKLFVTLYDSLGTKINFLSADDSYPVISPLCPKTVLCSTMTATISHSELNHVYVQDENDSRIVTELLDGLYAFYENEGKDLTLEPCVGSICVAKSLLDQNWYRALITEVSSEGVLVKYVDYGNTELLPFHDIRELHPDYYDINELCLETIAPDGFTIDNDNTEVMNIKLTQDAEGMWKLLLLDNTPVQNIVKEVNSDLEISQPIEPIVDALNDTSIVESENCVVISHIDSPGQFWIQYQDCISSLTTMHTNLQDVAEKLPSLTNLEVGEKCIAKYSIDDEWYRAEILDADSDITTVRFIDYGNTDVLNNSDNIIREIDGDIRATKPFAKRCSLMALPANGEEWNEEACLEFSKFSEIADGFTVEIETETEKCCYIKLISGERNICDELIQKEYAIVMENVNEVPVQNVLCVDSDVTSQKKSGYISHFVNISEFYVQLECDRPGLEYLEGLFVDAASFPAVSDILEDTICVAQYNEDNLWYRASINKILGDEYEVFFIDFGNIAITKELRELPQSAENIGQLAKQCSLSVPDGTHLSINSSAALQNLAADGLTVFDIEFLTLKSPYAVNLYLNSENIITLISKDEEIALLSEVNEETNIEYASMGNITNDSNVVTNKEVLHTIPSPIMDDSGIAQGYNEDKSILEKIECDTSNTNVNDLNLNEA